MNKKYIGLALTAVAVGGYVYYRFNKTEVDKKLQEYEDKAMAMLLNWQAKPEPAEVPPDVPVAVFPYPERDSKGATPNG